MIACTSTSLTYLCKTRLRNLIHINRVQRWSLCNIHTYLLIIICSMPSEKQAPLILSLIYQLFFICMFLLRRIIFVCNHWVISKHNSENKHQICTLHFFELVTAAGELQFHRGFCRVRSVIESRMDNWDKFFFTKGTIYTFFFRLE